jgi:hypothetical protein
MNLLKKIILILVIMAAAAGGWYEFYWRASPAYAAGEIQQAWEHKDLQKFKERVDMDKVYSYAVDDTALYMKEDGRSEYKLAASVLKLLKKQAVDGLVKETERRFREEGEKNPSGKPAQIVYTALGSAAISLTDIVDVKEEKDKAFVNVKLHDKKLDKDFTWKVQLEKDVNGVWTAVRIVNLKEYLAERNVLKK